jgi:hypothetical protein
MNSRQLEACRDRLYARAPMVGGWLRLSAARALARDNSAEAVRALAEALGRSDDVAVRGLAFDALLQLTNPRHIEAVGEVWLRTRHPELTRLLAECTWLAEAPLRVRVRHALLSDALAPGTLGAAMVEPLLESCVDLDAEVRRGAREALLRLGVPEAREALCRLATEPEQPVAREIALAAGYAPEDPGRRALFYFLTGQWERYEELDLDRGLLRAAYRAGTEELRWRIARQARRAGRADWAEIVTGGRQRRRLAEVSDPEWAAVRDALAGSQRWQEMWALAQEAPADWAARFLRLLREAGWAPPEGAGFAELARRADGWDATALPPPQRAATLAGHEEAVTCLAFTPDGSLLVSGSEDRTLRLWRPAEGEEVATLRGHTGGVTALAVRPDGRSLVSGSRDNTAVWWSLPEGVTLWSHKVAENQVSCVALSPSGLLATSGVEDPTVCLWDLRRGQTAGVLQGPRRTTGFLKGPWWTTTCAAFPPEGEYVLTGSLDGTVRLWALPDGAPLRLLAHATPMGGGSNSVASLALGGSGRLLASGGGTGRCTCGRYPTAARWETCRATATASVAWP